MTRELEQQLIGAIADEPTCRDTLLDALFVLRRSTWSPLERPRPADPTDRRYHVRVKLAALGRN